MRLARWSTKRTSLLAGVALCAVLSACTAEDSTPIDLGATTSPPVSEQPEIVGDDPNIGSRELVIELAEEECRKDPTREFGVVVFADPETGEEVNRYEHPCAEVDLESSVSGDQ